MEFITKIFHNKTNGQKSLVIPRGINKLKVDKLPDFVKVKITIPKNQKIPNSNLIQKNVKVQIGKTKIS